MSLIELFLFQIRLYPLSLLLVHFYLIIGIYNHSQCIHYGIKEWLRMVKSGKANVFWVINLDLLLH